MFTFALAFLLVFFQQPDDEATISSDGPQERNGSVFSTSINVEVIYQDIKVNADWIRYDESTNILEAGEAVHFEREGEKLDGKHLSINLTTKAGVLREARGNIGLGFYVTAAEVRRFEDGRYELHDATITNCEGPRMGWMFSTKRSVIDPNRARVSASGAVFRFEGVPVFYFPYLTAPTSERPRSSGFLIPSGSISSTKGRGLRQSFFYAINRSADATFSGEYFTKRGPAGSIGFRAVPNANTKVTIDSLFAKDRQGQGGQSVRILGFSEFGKGFRAVADMDFLSSFEFRQVYEEGINLISSPIEHSVGFLTNNQPRLSLNFLYNRSAIFFIDQPTVALRKFPTAEAEIPSTRLFQSLPIYFSLETGFTGLSRRDAVVRTRAFAERFDLFPTLNIPLLANNILEWSARIGVRETAYTHSIVYRQFERNALNRLSADYGMRLSGPHIERNFGTWSHVVEPTVEYRYIRGADRYQDTIIVDDVDLYSNTNELEYSLTNRIMTTREILSWRLAQKVYFDPTFGGAIMPGRRNVVAPLLGLTGFAFADGTRHLSPLVSTLRVTSASGVSTDLQVDYDTVRNEFRDAGIISGLNRGQVFSNVAYFFTKRSVIQEPNNQIRGLLGYGNQQKLGLSTAVSFSYDIHRSLFQQSTLQVGYNTDCYGVSLELTQFDIGSRTENRIRFAFTLKDIGSFGTIRPQERLF